MNDPWFLLLIPVSAYAGWWTARRLAGWRASRRDRDFGNQYFQGLNYLLNEQSDKAIEVFMELAEVNQETVETHLALGSLFRKRGEVDRAIRLHQNIISKPTLKEQQRTQALLELGEDYMRAGLFDRAEKLFSELTGRDTLAPTALRHLLAIYQQEKDWQSALDRAEQLEQVTGENMAEIKSHFSCELAQAELDAGNAEAARKLLRQARRQYPQGVRPRFILAALSEQQGDLESAMNSYEEIADMDIESIADFLESYLRVATNSDSLERAHARIDEWSGQYDGISLVLTRAEILQAQKGIGKAATYLADSLSARPSVRGLDRLISYKLEGGPDIESSDELLRAVAQRLLARQPTHRCVHCGFSGHAHHWQCPSCKHWGTTRTVRGVLGE